MLSPNWTCYDSVCRFEVLFVIKVFKREADFLEGSGIFIKIV